MNTKRAKKLGMSFVAGLAYVLGHKMGMDTAMNKSNWIQDSRCSEKTLACDEKFIAVKNKGSDKKKIVPYTENIEKKLPNAKPLPISELRKKENRGDGQLQNELGEKVGGTIFQQKNMILTGSQ